MALAPSRMQISRATSLLTRASGGRPIKRRASRMRDSGNRFRYGDCSSCTASACFRVPSKTESPVVLTKSASTTVSFSVRAWGRRERKNKPPPMRAAISTAATTAGIVHDLFCPALGCCPELELDGCPELDGAAVAAPLAGATAPDEAEATAG